jgi:hypothetical protein
MAFMAVTFFGIGKIGICGGQKYAGMCRNVSGLDYDVCATGIIVKT